MRAKTGALVVGLVAGVGILGGAGLYRRATSQPVGVRFSPHPAFALNDTGGKIVSVADVAERALPSVVNIASTRKVQMRHPLGEHPFFRDFFRSPSPRVERGLGSGVIVSADGVVVTNNHVVANADAIRVTTSDKREFVGKVVGRDPKSDLAVLRLQGAKGLRPITLGDSNKMRLGDVVLAIGNPFGVGQTVTMGIVSAKGRANVGIVDYEDFIQTDAAINPGNSGGALVNMRGELVGINTAILSRSGGYQGIGFAIPTNMAQPIMRSLLTRGRVVRGWLGVVIQNVDQDLARAMKLPTTRGVLVSDVDANGPGAQAGLRRGDLVVKINGADVDSSGTLRNMVASAGANNTITVEIYRAGKRQSLRVKLKELPSHLGGSGAQTTQAPLAVSPLTPNLRKQYSIPAHIPYGVVITSVKQGTPAYQAGLQNGDVILEVNQVKMKSVSTFAQVYGAARGRVLLLVYRQGSTHYLLIPK